VENQCALNLSNGLTEDPFSRAIKYLGRGS